MQVSYPNITLETSLLLIPNI